MEEWNKITSTKEYQTQATNDALTDGSSTYWQEKAFFENSGYAYLMGFEEQRGKIYNFNMKKVRDNTIKGEKILQYLISRV